MRQEDSNSETATRRISRHFHQLHRRTFVGSLLRSLPTRRHRPPDWQARLSRHRHHRHAHLHQVQSRRARQLARALWHSLPRRTAPAQSMEMPNELLATCGRHHTWRNLVYNKISVEGFNMKTCTKCFKSQETSQFNYKNRDKGIRHSHCKNCSRAYVKGHYERNTGYYLTKARARNLAIRQETQSRLLIYLSSHACVDCGESDPVVLDFDHIDGNKKSASIADMLTNRLSWSRIELEITKCAVRCANCHRRRTAKQFAWYKL